VQRRRLRRVPSPSPIEGGEKWVANKLTGFAGIMIIPQAAQKCPDARRPNSRGVRRTSMYAATTKEEGNAADGRFSAAFSASGRLKCQLNPGR
jgi:hypothetical protein